MDMDDPWGSPWADETQHPVIATKVNEDTKGNDTRPTTPVNTSSLGLEVKADSPWNDEDDGFGEWAAVPVVEEGRGNGLGFDGAGESWESRVTEDSTSTTKKSNFDGLNWKDDTSLQGDAISRFAPSLMPDSLAILRQPSPDPWATEATLNDGELIHDTPITEGRKPAMETMEGKLETELLGAVSEPILGSNIESLAELLPEPAEIMPAPKTPDGSDLGNSSSDGQETGTQVVEAADEVMSAHNADHESSRPSSSPSDQSHHDEILPESPRTSLDEEPKRLQATWKLSSKIQGLVEHFDGLARQEEEIVIEPGRSRSRSETPSIRMEKVIEESGERVKEEDDGKDDGKEDDDDFGDFEDGQSEAENTLQEEVKRPVTPIQAQNPTASSPASKMTTPQASPPESRYVKKDFGRVEFAFDTEISNNFYSDLGGDELQYAAVEKVFIRDTLPYDSFQNLEERKLWYRISRYGSMRKHNSGDDENYVRATWTQSQVREQTLKIVARWIEEDRISGRVVLGGGSKGSSIFGWNDPNAPAVPLASAFGVKQGRKPTPVSSNTEATPDIPREWPKGLVRDRSRSKSRSSPKASRRSSTKIVSISESHKGSPQTHVADFEWNSPTSGEQVAIPLSKEIPKALILNEEPVSPPRKSTSTEPQLSSSTVLSSGKGTQSKGLAEMNGLPTIASKVTIAATPPTLPPASNEDDDWGEMVASPIISIAPVLSTSQGLRHKKSQSLNGAFPPQLFPLPGEPPISPQSSVLSHKSTMSFDDIVVPKPRNSLDSKSNPFPPVKYSIAAASSISPITQTSPLPATSTTSNHDPWASADFSFFDSPIPATAPKPVLAPVSKPVPKADSFVKAPPAPSPLRNGKTRQELEQDEILASIVKSLPDLSYMLRR
jgi:hypothetical protein